MITWLDRIARAGMALGAGLMLQPWWQGGLRWGFFATACFSLLHILTSHLVVRERP
ncbi:MAG: hypothetical protein FJY95_05620 [Candidatus Handelsmanbacteria bacterium]|nr:hypothetical protein [Candidatus Handelsmanbacteria bacterium]